MIFATWDLRLDRPLLAVAVHAGHDLRPEIGDRMLLDEEERRREEDPCTDLLAASLGSSVAVRRSRFEVDLNRPRAEALYRTPADSWGLRLWAEPPSPDAERRSLSQYDDFYAHLAAALDRLVQRHGGFVLYDVHSYNHRRPGPHAPPEDPEANPTINLGTGSLPRRWEPVAETFMASMGRQEIDGATIDVGRDVKFEGRQVAAFVHDRYGDVACALAIEVKKVYMDEWTGDVDKERLDQVGEALRATCRPVIEEWRRVQGSVS